MTPVPELILRGQATQPKQLQSLSGEIVADEATPQWKKEVFQFLLQWLDDSDHIVQLSSGTTGKSKMIRLPKKSMMASAEATCRFFKLRKGQNALLCLPTEYIAGKMMIVRALVAGMDLFLTEPKSNPSAEGIDHIDFTAMVPFQVLNLIKSCGTLHPIRKLIIGGSEISRELEALLGPVDTEVYATYGMAETCSHVALQRINGPAPQKGFYPLPGVSLSTDERDCLVIKASYLPHPVVTNDLVQFIAPGAFRWIGRFDNLINSAGIKIVPEEMEAGITNVIGVECAIIGLPDARLGQKAVLVLEKRSDRSENEMKSILEKLYPRNIQPAIVWIEQFPRNDSYKLDRQRLAALIYGMI